MKKFFLLFFLVVSFLFVGAVKAEKITDYQSPLDNVARQTAIDMSSSAFDKAGEVVKAAFAIVAMAFFILMIYAGYMWFMARGDSEKVTKAKQIIISSIIGLVIIVSSFAISNFLTTRLVDQQSREQQITDGTVPSGCCLDLVQACVKDDPFTQAHMIPLWAWRITTQADCKSRGETNDRRDCYSAGEGVGWVWSEADNTEELCTKLYEAQLEKPLPKIKP